MAKEIRRPAPSGSVFAQLALRNRENIKPTKRLALEADLPYHRRRTGGRVVDGTALEMRHTCKGIVGSNPTLSAISEAVSALCGRHTFVSTTKSPIRAELLRK